MRNLKSMKKKEKPNAVKRNTGPKIHKGQIHIFRWFKKSFLGKSHNESVDLLDRWILKKKVMTLFF